MITINESEIEDEFEVCSYCVNPTNSLSHVYGCCGEVHFETAYVLTNNEIVLKSEVKIINKENE